jgi:hypothetical protein
MSRRYAKERLRENDTYVPAATISISANDERYAVYR